MAAERCRHRSDALHPREVFFPPGSFGPGEMWARFFRSQEPGAGGFEDRFLLDWSLKNTRSIGMGARSGRFRSSHEDGHAVP